MIYVGITVKFHIHLFISMVNFLISYTVNSINFSVLFIKSSIYKGFGYCMHVMFKLIFRKIVPKYHRVNTVFPFSYEFPTCVLSFSNLFHLFFSHHSTHTTLSSIIHPRPQLNDMYIFFCLGIFLIKTLVNL